MAHATNCYFKIQGGFTLSFIKTTSSISVIVRPEMILKARRLKFLEMIFSVVCVFTVNSEFSNLPTNKKEKENIKNKQSEGGNWQNRRESVPGTPEL